MKKYMCYYCAGISTGEEWNVETQRRFSDSITLIQDAFESNYYICPICNKQNEFPDMEQIKTNNIKRLD